VSVRRNTMLRAQAPLPVPRFCFVWRIGEQAPKRRHETVESTRRRGAAPGCLHPGGPWLIYAAELVDSVPSHRSQEQAQCGVGADAVALSSGQATTHGLVLICLALTAGDEGHIRQQARAAPGAGPSAPGPTSYSGA
jgi:hypothetical protein